MSTPSSAAISVNAFVPLDDLDPATPGDPFTRLRYHYGQLLGADDFSTEQRYFLLRSRLHNALLHGFGTVWGLRVDAQDVETAVRLTCNPGLAIDALGREIYVPQKVCLDVTGLAATRFWADLSPPPPIIVEPAPAAEAAPAVEAAPSGTAPLVTEELLHPTPGEVPPHKLPEDRRRRVYVVLRYRACLTELAPAVVPPCSDQDAALSPSRIADGYRLCLEAKAPAATGLPIRDIGEISEISEWSANATRQRILEQILNPPTDLARLWSGADDAPLLLAVLDLEAVGTPVHRVKLSGTIDNGVRALLPHVQTVADLALAIRLEEPAGTVALQAVGVEASAGAGPDAGRMVVAVRTSQPVLPDSVGAASVRVLRFDAGAKAWVEPVITACAPDPAGLSVTVDEAWPDHTCYQVCLAGTGAAALLDSGRHPLAGVAGEAVPVGVGRDACLFATHPPKPIA